MFRCSCRCGGKHHKACTPIAMVRPECPNLKMLHPETMSHSSRRTEHRNSSPAWTHGPPERRAACLCYMCLHACDACMLDMNCVCVVVCIAFCLYYKMHLVCVCVCVSSTVWPVLQKTEHLSNSASACYLWMFMICCASSVSASTWWPAPFWYVNLLDKLRY